MNSSLRGIEPTREVRLGIVMYGGVSLAVYENGVAQELFRAVKGEGVYTLIKAITQSDLIVDIMSGTSAGGINGVFLGYALANGLNFKSSANLWRNDGDLMKLLRKPSDDNDYSILDSQGYYQEHLQAAFKEMKRYAPEYPERLALVSEISDLDMFVTSTNVDGNIFTEFDDEGHAIDVKDHRQVFRLLFREGRQNNFEPEYSEALAKLCRATSCFPVAFEPVHVKRGTQTDDLMMNWGNANQEAYFLDGGLLNNKPFTLTLDPIFHRTEDREVDRLLLYIEPDPEGFAQDKEVIKPDVAKSAADALVTIPGYQSIAADLQAIAEHNDRVSRYKEIIDSLSQTEPGSIPSEPLDFQALKTDLPRRDSYLQCRLSKLRDRAVDAILKQQDGQRELLLDGKRKAGKVLVESFQEWNGQSTPQNGADQNDDGTETLKEFDVYYRLRRLYRLTYLLSSKLQKSGGQDDEKARQHRDLWRRVNYQIKILEVIHELMERLLDLADVSFGDLERQKPSLSVALSKWAQLQALMRALLVPVPESSIDAGVKQWSETDDSQRIQDQRRQRLELREALADRLAVLLADRPTSSARPDRNLLSQTDELEVRVLRSYDLFPGEDSAWAEYCRFVVTDSYIFPLQYMTNSESLDRIRTVRISPIDAQIGYSRRSLDKKLCGRQLGHFGAFMKSSWRANDLMWGRLDAVCQLIQSLITPDRIRTVAFDPQNAAVLCDSLFPQSSSSERDQLRTELAQLRSYTAGADDREASEKFKKFWDLLSCAAQREIIEEEIPNVLNAALAQQADWNEFDIKTVPESKLLSRRYKWIPGIRNLDHEAYRFAIAKLIEGSKPPGGWIKYFDEGYAVGAETWRDDIPKPVLAEMVLTISLLLRNSLLRVAGPYAERIRQSFIYRALVSWPLTAAYYFVRSQRTMPEYRSLINGVLATLSLAFLSMGVLEYAEGGSLFQHLSRKVVFLWFAVPIAVLIPLVWYLRWSQTKKRRTIYEQTAFSALIAAVAILVLYFHYPQHVFAHFYDQLSDPFRFAIATATGSLVLFAIAVFSLSRRWAGSGELSIVRKAIGLTSLVGSLSLGMSLGGLSLGGFAVKINCPPAIAGEQVPHSTRTPVPTSSETPLGKPIDKLTPTATLTATPTATTTPGISMTTWPLGCVGPFNSGETKLKDDQPPGKGCISVADMISTVQNAVKNKYIRSMILRGNADKFGLRPALRREFGSNAGLARSRAEWVRTQLMSSQSPAVQSVVSQAIVLIEGPQKYGEELKPTGTWEDRVVWIMGGW